MRFTRALLSVVIVLAAWSVHASPAVAAPGKPYWKNKSNLPVDTVAGEWKKARRGRAAVLTFTGENVPAQRTRFVAGWRSPWTRPGTELQDKGRLDLLLPPSGKARLVKAARVQVKGKPWSRWFKTDLPFEGGLSLGGSGGWIARAGLFGPSPKVRYEWRLVGKVEGLAQIDGRVKLSLR